MVNDGSLQSLQAIFSCLDREKKQSDVEDEDEDEDAEDEELSRLSSPSLPLPPHGCLAHLCFHHQMTLALASHLDSPGSSESYLQQRQKLLTAAAMRSRSALSCTGGVGGLTIEILVCAEEAGSGTSGRDGGEAWEVGAAHLELVQAFDSEDGALLSLPLVSRSDNSHLGVVSVRIFAQQVLAAIANAAENLTQMKTRPLAVPGEVSGGCGVARLPALLQDKPVPSTTLGRTEDTIAEAHALRQLDLEGDLMRVAATNQQYKSKTVGKGKGHIFLPHGILRQETKASSAASRPISGTTKYDGNSKKGSLH
jgi:hypothetical protein